MILTDEQLEALIQHLTAQGLDRAPAKDPLRTVLDVARSTRNTRRSSANRARTYGSDYEGNTPINRLAYVGKADGASRPPKAPPSLLKFNGKLAGDAEVSDILAHLNLAPKEPSE